MSNPKTPQFGDITRRQFVGGLGGALAVTSLGGGITKALAQDSGVLLEAPMLKARVDAGELPPPSPNGFRPRRRLSTRSAKSASTVAPGRPPRLAPVTPHGGGAPRAMKV